MNRSLTDEHVRAFKDKIHWGTLINFGRILTEEQVIELQNDLYPEDLEDILNESKKFNFSKEFVQELRKKIKAKKNAKES